MFFAGRRGHRPLQEIKNFTRLLFCKKRKLILAVDSKTTFVGGDVLDAPLSIVKYRPPRKFARWAGVLLV